MAKIDELKKQAKLKLLRQKAKEKLRQSASAAEPEAPGALAAVGGGLQQGLTFGFSDEIFAGTKAFFDSVKAKEGNFLDNLAEAYQSRIEEERAELAQEAEAHPFLFHGTDIASSLALPFGVGALGKGAKAAQLLKGALLPTTAKGLATLGATEALGRSEAETLPGMLAETAGGAVLGAGIAKLGGFISRAGISKITKEGKLSRLTDVGGKAKSQDKLFKIARKKVGNELVKETKTLKFVDTLEKHGVLKETAEGMGIRLKNEKPGRVKQFANWWKDNFMGGDSANPVDLGDAVFELKTSLGEDLDDLLEKASKILGTQQLAEGSGTVILDKTFSSHELQLRTLRKTLQEIDKSFIVGGGVDSQLKNAITDLIELTKTKKMTMPGIRTARQRLDTVIWKSKAMSLPNQTKIEGLKKISRHLNDILETNAEKAFKGGGKKFRELNEDLSSLMRFEDTLGLAESKFVRIESGESTELISRSVEKASGELRPSGLLHVTNIAKDLASLAASPFRAGARSLEQKSLTRPVARLGAEVERQTLGTDDLVKEIFPSYDPETKKISQADLPKAVHFAKRQGNARKRSKLLHNLYTEGKLDTSTIPKDQMLALMKQKGLSTGPEALDRFLKGDLK